MLRARATRRPTAAVRVSILFVVLGLGAGLAGCAGASSEPPGNPTPGATADATPSSPAPDPANTATPDPAATDGPAGTPAATPPATPAAACSGSDANREFFAQAARSMAWSVYCAVLPEGWFVEQGNYQLAAGGRLDVTYRGPSDARLSLAEGTLCANLDVDACAPRDTVLGPAAFGDLEGELGQLATGLVLDVGRGANPSWRASGLGLDEAGFRELGAALLLVSD